MDRIEVSASGSISCVGPEAVEVFRLASLISALKLEKVGLKLSRGMSALKVAKATTGMRTNDRDQHIARLRVMLDEQKGKVAHEVVS